MSILIKNALVLDMVSDNPNIQKKDVLIKNNIIEEISNQINCEATQIIDATGMVLMPGLVNTHTHLPMSIFKGYKDDKSLMDWLQNAIFPVEDKLQEDDFFWNSYLSCIEMIKSGTTTCNDMYFGTEKILEAIEKVGLRALVSWCVKDNSISDIFEKTREYAKKYNNSDSKIKIWVAPHAPYTCNPKTIEKCVNLAKELNTGIHVHLAETQDEINIIQEIYKKTPTEYLNDLNVFDVPTILAHGIYLTDSDIELIKNKRTGIAHNPISNCKLASGICNVTKLHKNGIKVGIGTDGSGSTTTLDMFEEMKLTAYLQKVNTLNPMAIKAYDILKMATIEGAKILCLDKEIGTIECGKKADIILIDINKPHLYPNNDIVTNLVYSANGADVDTVIIDGKIKMKNRKLINIDEKEIFNKIDEIIKRLL